MKKVLTERPRGGWRYKSPKGERRRRQRTGMEEQPRREKIQAKWGNQKHFTDVLGPLRRFLLKQVNRPWDKVYSEIAAHLPKTSMQNRHVYTHLWQYVERDVDIIDGKPFYRAGFGHRAGRPIESFRGCLQLYIHPVTGLLRKAPKHVRKEKPIDQPGVKVYPGVQYHRVDRVWYEVSVRKFPSRDEMKDQASSHPYPGCATSPFSAGIDDNVLGRRYASFDELWRIYGGGYIAVSKRRLPKRAIRRAGLV
jgi:hypothetical protein